MTAERQLGYLWGTVAAALLLLSPLAPEIAGGLPACPLKSLSGLPCPACGSGRAALALARLDPPAALASSPLAAAGWIALVGGGLAAGALALTGRPLPRLPAPPSPWLRLGILTAILANWIYLMRSGA